jgi:hypothetical protein
MSVIGDNIYELHFMVEPEGMQDSLQLLDMEDDTDDFDKKEEEDGGGMYDQHDFMQEDNNQSSLDKGVREPWAHSVGSQDGSKGKMWHTVLILWFWTWGR